MKGLILVAHGSKRNDSNEEVISLAHQVEEISVNYFDATAYAFLEFARPTILSQIEEFATKGVTHIVVFPLFLTSGNHVQRDLPQIIQNAQHKYSDITFTVTPHLGSIDGIHTLIGEYIKNLP